MDIRLSPELEAIVVGDLASGRFSSVAEYIAEAVELLHEREQWRGESIEEQRVKMEAALAQADNGDLMDEAEVRAEMEQIKVQWRERPLA